LLPTRVFTVVPCGPVERLRRARRRKRRINLKNVFCPEASPSPSRCSPREAGRTMKGGEGGRGGDQLSTLLCFSLVNTRRRFALGEERKRKRKGKKEEPNSALPHGPSFRSDCRATPSEKRKGTEKKKKGIAFRQIESVCRFRRFIGRREGKGGGKKRNSLNPMGTS